MIDKVPPLRGVTPAEQTKRSKPAKKVSRGRDSVEISNSARLQAQEKTILQSPVVQETLAKPLDRDEVVAEVKSKIAHQTYQKNSQKILEHLARELFA